MSSNPRFYDRVSEVSATTGTGSYTLDGPATGYQSFAVVGDGNSCFYCATDVDANGTLLGDWEIGVGTYTASGTTLSRDSIHTSSNAGSAVNWGSGTRRVFLIVAASYFTDGVQLLPFGGTSASFPALKRTSTKLSARLADDSGDASLGAGNVDISNYLVVGFGSNPSATGAIRLPNNTVGITTRNAANTGDIGICTTDGSDNVRVGLLNANSIVFLPQNTEIARFVPAAGLQMIAAAAYYWSGRSVVLSPSDGVVTVSNNSQTDFNRFQLGGTTSSFPALKRSTTHLQVRLADDSDFTVIDVNGVKFPATQTASSDANTLDDYEEGTWTPVLGGSGGTTGQSYTVQYGRYVKIGQAVHANGYIVLSNKGTITGNLQIQGLPFTASNDSANNYNGQTLPYYANFVSAFSSVAALVYPNQTYAYLFAVDPGGATFSDVLVTGDIGNTSNIAFTLTYTASA